VAARIQQAYRPATRKTQQLALKTLALFCCFHNLRFPEIHKFTLFAFIEFLIENHLSVATIKNYIAAIKATYIVKDWNMEAFESRQLSLIFTSITRNLPQPYRHKPVISPQQFILMYTKALLLPTAVFFRMAIIMGYFGFCRISNVAVQSLAAYDLSRDIRRGDIRVVHNGIMLHLRWTKTLQAYRQTADIFLPALPGSPVCPLKNFLLLKSNYPVASEAPLLSYRAGNTTRVITQAIIRGNFANIRSKLNLSNSLTFHALRRSGASAAFAGGVPFQSIQAHGTWSSDALWAYIDSGARDNLVPAYFSQLFSTL
jgi:integrase